MILISPWSRNTNEGKPSPKNYPHWPELVKAISAAGFECMHLACTGEPEIAGVKRLNDVSLENIGKLLKTCQTWISVDNFFHHMAWTLGEPGVVLFGMSDPLIFGHPENINLLKDRKYLRTRQFGLWSQEPPNPNAFVEPGVVVEAALSLIRKKGPFGLYPGSLEDTLK